MRNKKLIPFEIIEKSMIFHMFFGSGTLRENPTSAKSAIHFTINQPRCHPASNPEIKQLVYYNSSYSPLQTGFQNFLLK